MEKDIKALVAAHKDELLDKLGKLVSIKSERGEASEGAPFGEGPKEVLIAALDMADQEGFKTVNLDNYIGYAEMGEGDQLIGIIGHLDVVPADINDGWNTDPYTMTVKDGITYGRGVADDKGAVAASMIAMEVLKELEVPVTKRIRLIMGTNEESGSACLHHYVEKEGHVDYGFTPDGDFPCVYGEKGMVSALYRSKKTNLIDIQGGTVGNIVCAKCTAKVQKCTYSTKKLNDFFNNNNIEYSVAEADDCSVITVNGVAAHASLPELGVNAISYLLVGLKEAGLQDPFVDFYCEHFGLETNGASCGAGFTDEYGALTLNTGVIHMKDGVIEGTVDIRFPVTYTSKQIVKGMEPYMSDDNGEIVIRFTHEPLFFPPDSPLVSSLVSAYVDVTGDTVNKPMVIGGGTYAKSIHNTIAFGCAFPDKDYRIHNTNEWCPVDELLLQAEIYVHALLKLLEI